MMSNIEPDEIFLKVGSEEFLLGHQLKIIIILVPDSQESWIIFIKSIIIEAVDPRY